jgi:hypothetical protein
MEDGKAEEEDEWEEYEEEDTEAEETEVSTEYIEYIEYIEYTEYIGRIQRKTWCMGPGPGPELTAGGGCLRLGMPLWPLLVKILRVTISLKVVLSSWDLCLT